MQADSSRRYRFSRDNRLLDAAAFGRVFDKATRSHDRYFTVLGRQNRKAEPRLGLAVSKKHCRKASRRNLIKRIARESFRLNKQQLEGLDLVVINKPASATATRRQLSESLDSHWQTITHRCHGHG